MPETQVAQTFLIHILLATLFQLAKTYSYAHGWMHRGWNCGDYFVDGITNGASWYSLSKGRAGQHLTQWGADWQDILGLKRREGQFW